MNTRTNCQAFVRAPKQAQLYRARRNPQVSAHAHHRTIVPSRSIVPAPLRKPALLNEHSFGPSQRDAFDVSAGTLTRSAGENAAKTASDAKASGFHVACDGRVTIIHKFMYKVRQGFSALRRADCSEVDTARILAGKTRKMK